MRWLRKSIGVGCVAAGIAAAWTVRGFSAAPTAPARPPVRAPGALPLDLPAVLERSGVRLDFSEPPTPERPVALPADRPSVPLADRLQFPAELPGGDATPIKLPAFDPANPKLYEEALQKLYPPLPGLGENPEPVALPGGRAVSIVELERTAQARNPILVQGAAAVRAAQGDVRQAGLRPNPVVGYMGQDMRMGNTAGTHGGFVSQELVRRAKLDLAQAVASADREMARAALGRLEVEVLADVRAGFFSVLAAHETMRVQHALARLADDAYRLQVDQVKAGQAAPFQPMQLRVQAMQARAALVQARNRYASAWRQLASALGQPELSPTLLEGNIEWPLPALEHDALRETAWARHTDLRAADQAVAKAEAAHRLAYVNRVPNPTMQFAAAQDYTSLPNNAVFSVQVEMPVPIFNRNQGTIERARAELDRARVEADRVRNQIASQLAEAYERYDNQRRLLAYYRDHMLADQTRVYRGVYGRFQQDPERVTFSDVVMAQQTLGSAVSGYVSSLREAWIAVVDIGRIVQAPDLFAMATRFEGPPPCPGGCRGLPDLLPPPTPAPDTASPPCDSGCATPPASPREVHPVTGPLSILPFAPLERSTKRRRFFSWPTKRSDAETPLTLPTLEEPAPCCPQNLPAPATPTPEPQPTPPRPLPRLPESRHETPVLPAPTRAVDPRPLRPVPSTFPIITEGPSTPRPLPAGVASLGLQPLPE